MSNKEKTKKISDKKFIRVLKLLEELNALKKFQKDIEKYKNDTTIRHNTH